MKVTHRGLLPPDDPIYKRGWTLYIGPLQVPAATPSKDTEPKKSESTAPSEKSAAENPAE